MSAGDIVCARCSAVNKPTAERCWVCYSPLAGAEPSAAPPLADTVRTAPGARARAVQPKPSTMSVVLKVVIIMIGIVTIIPVLLIVTCFGAIALSSYH
jgi:hypothetical protein